MSAPEFTTEEMVRAMVNEAGFCAIAAVLDTTTQPWKSIYEKREGLFAAIAARLSDLPDVSAALALLDEFSTLKAWDAWRASIAKGDVGSWPRDCYESQLDAIREALTSRTPWQPPPEAERADGFRCLGMWSTRWVVCEWTDIGHAETRMGWLPFPNGHTAITPTAFAPLPPPQKESTDG